MIPDFKTYIGESAWGDMMRRGSGDTIRKEDDLNHLSLFEFYEHLTHIYKKTGVINYIIGYDDKRKCISVPLFLKHNDVFLFFIEEDENGIKKMDTSLSFKRNTKKLIKKLEEEFNIECDNIGISHISPKNGGPVTNNFIVKVIDSILGCADESFKRIIEKI